MHGNSLICGHYEAKRFPVSPLNRFFCIDREDSNPPDRYLSQNPWHGGGSVVGHHGQLIVSRCLTSCRQSNVPVLVS